MMAFMALTIIRMHLKLYVGACVARPAWNVNIRQLIPAAPTYIAQQQLWAVCVVKAKG